MYNDSLDVADTKKLEAEKLDTARKIVERRLNESNTQRNTQKHQDNKGHEPFLPTSSLLQKNVDTDMLKNTADSPSPSKKRGRPGKKIDISKQIAGQGA